ncbi:MAG: hypothetical protein ABEJ70_03665 [Halobacteriaceae archaeon]
MSDASTDRDHEVGKLPRCPECGYSPTDHPEWMERRLANAGYDRPYVEVKYGLDRDRLALLCPVCGTVIRRTD